MVGEGIQNYVDMAAGLTKATREKATAAAKNLLATAGLEDVATDATDRVGKLTEEIMAASRANRDLMGKLIAAEVDKAAAKLGFVRAEELDDLRRELSELRMSMAHAAAHTDEPSPPMPETVVSDPLQADPFRGDPVFDGSVVDDPLLPGTAPLSEPVDAPPIEPIAEPIDEPVVSTTALKAARRAPTKKAAAKKAPAKAASAQSPATAAVPGRTAKKTARTAKTAKAPSAKVAVTAPATKAAARKISPAKKVTGG